MKKQTISQIDIFLIMNVKKRHLLFCRNYFPKICCRNAHLNLGTRAKVVSESNFLRI